MYQCSQQQYDPSMVMGMGMQQQQQFQTMQQPMGMHQMQTMQQPMGLQTGALLLNGHRFRGVIKSYSQINGYGFIGGDEIMAHIGKDVFLHQREVTEVTGVTEPHLPANCTLTFTVNINAKGQPQARDLCFDDHSFLQAQLGAGTNLPMIGSASDLVHGGKRFTGFVRSYSQLKGFGFIGGEEISATFGKDVFLHFREVVSTEVLASTQKPYVPTGVWVTFVVTLNQKGQPQARDVRFADGQSQASVVNANLTQVAASQAVVALQQTWENPATNLAGQAAAALTAASGLSLMADNKGVSASSIVDEATMSRVEAHIAKFQKHVQTQEQNESQTRRRSRTRSRSPR
eukprot:GEMP01020316.1.p1 GENE.GEMP01020316.1~~GEMP01020316.1.p1  ORF type:complete len:374 (+),score=93.32 GEMP01020316.1:88-1122(+)